MLVDLNAEPVDEKLRRCKSDWIRHEKRMNNNRMPKHNAELQTIYTKTTWNTYKETTGRGQNMSIKVCLVTDDEHDDDKLGSMLTEAFLGQFQV